jgi:phospholipase C
MRLALLAPLVAILTGAYLTASAHAALPPAGAITHIVVVDQENHSFDNMLGGWCSARSRCGAEPSTAPSSSGARIPIRQRGGDVVPRICHLGACIDRAVNNGAMDHFDHLKGCGAADGYACLVTYQPGQIPNLATLADTGSVATRSFFHEAAGSWISHLTLFTADIDGFERQNPEAGGSTFGCLSSDPASQLSWRGVGSSTTRKVPSCVPFADGTGAALGATPVPHVATLMDRMQAAGVSWKLYAGSNLWSACPDFADCIRTNQADRSVPVQTFIPDAAACRLPTVSYVTPQRADSQHNGYSITQGDDWIGAVTSAIEACPDQWAHTLLVVTYDDCGCFYDHVAPPGGTDYGLRAPLVLAGPWVQAGCDDAGESSTDGIMSLVEHLTGTSPVTTGDATAYDYSACLSLVPSSAPAPVMVQTPVPPRSERYIAKHPTSEADPT